MSTDVMAGIGTIFQVGTNASPIVYTAVARVISIGGPNLSSEQVEITTLDSSGGYKEFINGLKDGGEFTLELYWKKSDAKQVILRNALGSETSLPMKVIWPDSPSTRCAFLGLVTGFTMNTVANEGVKATITIKISGAPTWT